MRYESWKLKWKWQWDLYVWPFIPCLSCPAWRRGSRGWRLWRGTLTRSCRRWSWWAAPSTCRWFPRSRSARCRHPPRAQTPLLQRCEAHTHREHKTILNTILQSWLPHSKACWCIWSGSPWQKLMNRACFSQHHFLAGSWKTRHFTPWSFVFNESTD